MANGDAIATVALDQSVWSETANGLKQSITSARWTVLALAVFAAISETWASQIHVKDPETSLALGYAGAAALAIVAVVRQRKLGHERVQAWIVARSGSEAFKREMYLFRTATGPYASGNRAPALMDRRDEILQKLRSVQSYRVEPRKAPKPAGSLDAQGYLDERINGQIEWFKKRAAEFSSRLKLLTGTEFLLALAGALLGAALTITGKQVYGAWVAVITTVTGAVAAHALAQRYEQLIVSYRAASDRLTGIVGRWKARESANLAELVEPCEAVLLEENQSWIAGADPGENVPAAPRNDRGTP